VFPNLLQQIVWIFPAYIANALPVFSKFRFLTKINFPLDFNKRFIDKKRIFGNSKTFIGCLFGLFGGTCFGVFLIGQQLLLSFALSAGAIIGDLIASFFKRRFSIKVGEPIPILDQLDFLIGSFLFVFLLCMIFPGVIGKLPWNLRGIIVIFIITPPLHKLSNVIGYILRVKNVPW
jgi:CDP-2,3-bis-(O-geranylgeranyl)-sn-glycerol synthase